MSTFPFGRPARGAPRAPPDARPVFVLGAYPSALHVRWVPPSPWKPVKAIAVDLEPEPFWNGADEVARIAAWREAVGWLNEWGEALRAGKLNGSSGVWVDERILEPLGVGRAAAWITDALDWYCMSTGAATRIADTYEPFARERGDLPKVELPAHPDENQIVRDAVATELPRLRSELAAAMPDIIVTLGNAALRVMAELIDSKPNTLPRKLLADASYGSEIGVSVAGRLVRWIPLAHPASPPRYQSAHERWMSSAPKLGHR